MSEQRESKSVPSEFADERVVAWIEEHEKELRQSASGQHFLYWSLALGFLVGLAAHVGGYALRSSFPNGVPGLVADLLYALGWSLWTGAVVALFIQVIPEAKRRQIRRSLAAYEAFKREKEERKQTHEER